MCIFTISFKVFSEKGNSTPLRTRELVKVKIFDTPIIPHTNKLITSMLPSLLTVVLTSLALLCIILVSKVVLAWYRFKWITALKNKNNKKYNTLPFHYGFGTFYDFVNPKDCVNRMLKTLDTFGDDMIADSIALGSPAISVFNPDYLKQILSTQQHLFPKHASTTNSVKVLLGDGLATSGKALHSKQRRLLNPIFSPFNLDKMSETMNELTVQEMKKLDPNVSDNIDMMNWLTALTLKVIAQTALGAKNIDSMIDKWNTVSYLFPQAVAFDGLGLSKCNLIPICKRFNATKKELVEEIASLIQARRVQLAKSDQEDMVRTDFLSLLILARDDDNCGISDGQIIDECLTILFAGHETSASLLSSLFYVLAQRKDIQDRIHEELDSLLKHQEITSELVKSLDYTSRCLKETLRFYPPGVNIFKMPNQDIWLGDYFVPKGTQINVHILALHRSEKIWKNASVFDPDRWTEERLNKELKYDLKNCFLPFSQGTRDCIGKNFALLESSLILCHILKGYTVSYADGYNPENVTFDVFTTTTISELRLKFNRRN